MKSTLQNSILIYGVANIFPHGSKTFKQLQLQDIIEIPQQKPDMEQIVSISAKIEVIKTDIISTAVGQSCGGQILTGRKLVVDGKVHQKLEYVADLVDQPIHAAHFAMPFSSFIVLGKDIECYSEFDVTGYIEDVFVKKLDNRKMFKNILFLLNAVPVSKI